MWAASLVGSSRRVKGLNGVGARPFFFQELDPVHEELTCDVGS